MPCNNNYMGLVSNRTIKHMTCNKLTMVYGHAVYGQWYKINEVYKKMIHYVISWMSLYHKHLCYTLQWRHNDRDGISNHQPHDCLLNRIFRCTSKKISKLLVTGLCAGNSPMTSEFPAQRDSNAENVSIWWRHHDINCWVSVGFGISQEWQHTYTHQHIQVKWFI